MKETPPLSRNFLCLEATEIGYRSRNPRPPPGPSGGQPSVPAAPTLSLRSVQRKLTPICRALRLDIRSHPPLDQLENQRFIQGIGHLLCQAQGREGLVFPEMFSPEALERAFALTGHPAPLSLGGLSERASDCSPSRLPAAWAPHKAPHTPSHPCTFSHGAPLPRAIHHQPHPQNFPSSQTDPLPR